MSQRRRWRFGRSSTTTSTRKPCLPRTAALKRNVDDALRDSTSIRRVIVFRRAGNDIHMEEGRDVWWHRELQYVDANCPPAPHDSEHPLYLLYTSGSTG